LPQPKWFAAYAVGVQEADPGSTLNLYRRALALRNELFAADDLRWVESESSVLHFARPGGVRCITNFGIEPIALPASEILLSSGQLDHGRLPSDTTVWLRAR
jgi:alpha-glucosidase